MHKTLATFGSLVTFLGVAGLIENTEGPAFVPPVYAAAPVITPEHVQQWGPIVGSIVMTASGPLMVIYSRITKAREERLRSGFGAIVTTLTEDLAELKAESIAERAVIKESVKALERRFEDAIAMIAASESKSHARPKP